MPPRTVGICGRCLLVIVADAPTSLVEHSNSVEPFHHRHVGAAVRRDGVHPAEVGCGIVVTSFEQRSQAERKKNQKPTITKRIDQRQQLGGKYVKDRKAHGWLVHLSQCGGTSKGRHQDENDRKKQKKRCCQLPGSL